MTKIINKNLLSCIIIIMVLISVLFFAFVNNIKKVPVSKSNFINKIILGNPESESKAFLDQKNINLNITEDKNSNKKHNAVFSQAKNISISLTKNEYNYYDFYSYGLNLNYVLKNKLTSDTNVKIYYDRQGEVLNFIIPEYQYFINNNLIGTRRYNLYYLNNIKKDKILKIGEEVIYMDEYNNDHFLLFDTLRRNTVMQYVSNHNNLIEEVPSNFSGDPWTSNVVDCSDKLPGEPQIYMSLEKLDDNQYLKLSSKNHFACTNKTFEVGFKSGNLYKLSFNYKNSSGSKVKYYYRVGEGSDEFSKSEVIEVDNSEWNNFSTIIEPNANYDKINIHFYAPSDGTEEVVNFYDNVRLEEYIFERELELEKNIDLNEDLVLAEGVTLNDGENRFDFIKKENNLLKNDEASFEKGLWNNKVDDCCDTREGEADISMELSKDATNGDSSLQLTSNNHCACCNKTFTLVLEDDKTYKFSFDYKNLVGNKIQYYYNLRNTINKNEEKTEIINVGNNNWNHFETVINSDLNNIKFIDIYFYAASVDSGEIVNLYDNVRLTEWLPKDIDSYYLYAEQEVDESPKLEAVEYKAVNRWKNQVVLHGVNNSFLMVYPEAYSEKWKAYPVAGSAGNGNLSVPDNYSVPEIESNRQATKEEVQGFIDGKLLSATGSEFISKNFGGSIRNDNMADGWFFGSWFKKPIAEEIHYQVNNYGNSWWIDVEDLCQKRKVCQLNADGTYDISLIVENKLNRIFNTILILTSLAFVATLGYLGYDFMRRRRQKHLKNLEIL